jgi:hypothetical protein
MAQADSVPSSSRQLITGKSANQSTNLRVANLPAVNLPAVRVKPADRPVDGSDARVIIGSDKAPLLRLWREKRGDRTENLLKSSCYGINACQAPVDSNGGARFFANAVLFLGRLLRRIVQIILPLASDNKRLRNRALDKASSNRLLPSKQQERLR